MIWLKILEKMQNIQPNVKYANKCKFFKKNPKKIKKVTSGSTPEIADFVDDLYNSVLINGTHKASSIKVVFENKFPSTEIRGRISKGNSSHCSNKSYNSL